MSSEVGSGRINLDNLKTQSESSSDCFNMDFACQVLEGDEMNAQMANFIGIHRMQSLRSPQSVNQKEDGQEHSDANSNVFYDIDNNENQDDLDASISNIEFPFTIDSEELEQIFGSGDNNEDSDEEEQYTCPQTGAHFHKADLYKRILKLQKRRALIDRAIAEEQRIQEMAMKKVEKAS